MDLAHGCVELVTDRTEPPFSVMMKVRFVVGLWYYDIITPLSHLDLI